MADRQALGSEPREALLAALQFIPGTTLTGALALGLMHAVVAAVAVPVYLRIAPLPA